MAFFLPSARPPSSTPRRPFVSCVPLVVPIAASQVVLARERPGKRLSASFHYLSRFEKPNGPIEGKIDPPCHPSCRSPTCQISHSYLFFASFCERKSFFFAQSEYPNKMEKICSCRKLGMRGRTNGGREVGWVKRRQGKSGSRGSPRGRRARGQAD